MTGGTEDARPLYVQVADGLRTAIGRGEFKVGEKLPSYAELSTKYRVSHMTINQAIGILKRERTVTARQGMGVFVRTLTPEPAAAVSLDALVVRLAQLEARVDHLEARFGHPGRA